MSVFAVVSYPEAVVPMTRFALRLARAYGRRLVVAVIDHQQTVSEPRSLLPGAGNEPSMPELLRSTAAELDRLLNEDPPETTSAEPAAASPEPQQDAETEAEIEILELPTANPLQAVLQAQRNAKAELLVISKQASRDSSKQVSLARKLFDAAPCRTLLVRFADILPESEPPSLSCRRVLVGTAGGHHARAALQIGDQLARAEDGELRALMVQSPAVEFAREVGQRTVKNSLAAAGIAGSPVLKPQVELAEVVDDGIRAALEEGTDLLLLGASNAGQLRRQLFGTVPERYLASDGGLVVGVVRERWRLFHRLRTRLGRWLDLTIPQMTRDERVALYEQLQSGSLWRFDFLTLMILSTAIAGLGLLQSSAAVVIGAMLVAPLMTPILGAGLGLVQGNLLLLRDAAKAIFYGYLSALAIGFFLGLLVPLPELTTELLARGGPTLLDLGVALFSGIAAAYCLSRPGLTAALPGVAIAAAMVPPIATTGISIAHGEVANARGAALLFGVNVVAIVLGAALAFYAGGVRGKRGARNQTWVRAGFLALLIAVAVLAVPLGSELLSGLRAGEQQATIGEPLRQQLRQAVSNGDRARISRLELRRRNQRPVLEIEIESPRPIASARIAKLGRLARQTLGSDTTVRVHHHQVVESLPPRREIP